jgi:hypothetical protein
VGGILLPLEKDLSVVQGLNFQNNREPLASTFGTFEVSKKNGRGKSKNSFSLLVPRNCTRHILRLMTTI